MKAEALSVADVRMLERVADQVATKYFIRHGYHIERDEFYQSAWEGFLKGLAGYDPARSTLHTFARMKMEFGCQDYVRNADHLSRVSRREVKAGTRDDAGREVALDFTVLNESLFLMLEAGYEQAERQVTLAAFEAWVVGQRWWTDRWDEIYRLRKSGLTMQEVADMIGVTESYISQVEKQIRGFGERWGRGEYRMAPMTTEEAELARVEKQLRELRAAYKRLDDHTADQLLEKDRQIRVLTKQNEAFKAVAKSLLLSPLMIRYRNIPQVRTLRNSLELDESIYIGIVPEAFLDLRDKAEEVAGEE